MRAVLFTAGAAPRSDGALPELALARPARTIAVWSTPEHDPVRPRATGTSSTFMTIFRAHGRKRRRSVVAGVRTGILIVDDWPERIPVTEAELDVIEAHFGHLLDELFGRIS